MSPKNEDTPLNASSALNLAAIHFASVKLRSLDELLEVVPKKVPRRRHEKYQPRTVIAFLSVFDLCSQVTAWLGDVQLRFPISAPKAICARAIYRTVSSF